MPSTTSPRTQDPKRCPLSPADRMALQRIDSDLAEIDAAYVEIGDYLITLDARKRQLAAERKSITKRMKKPG